MGITNMVDVNTQPGSKNEVTDKSIRRKYGHKKGENKNQSPEEKLAGFINPALEGIREYDIAGNKFKEFVTMLLDMLNKDDQLRLVFCKKTNLSDLNKISQYFLSNSRKDAAEITQLEMAWVKILTASLSDIEMQSIMQAVTSNKFKEFLEVSLTHLNQDDKAGQACRHIFRKYSTEKTWKNISNYCLSLEFHHVENKEQLELDLLKLLVKNVKSFAAEGRRTGVILALLAYFLNTNSNFLAKFQQLIPPALWLEISDRFQLQPHKGLLNSETFYTINNHYRGLFQSGGPSASPADNPEANNVPSSTQLSASDSEGEQSVDAEALNNPGLEPAEPPLSVNADNAAGASEIVLEGEQSVDTEPLSNPVLESADNKVVEPEPDKAKSDNDPGVNGAVNAGRKVILDIADQSPEVDSDAVKGALAKIENAVSNPDGLSEQARLDRISEAEEVLKTQAEAISKLSTRAKFLRGVFTAVVGATALVLGGSALIVLGAVIAAASGPLGAPLGFLAVLKGSAVLWAAALATAAKVTSATAIGAAWAKLTYQKCTHMFMSPKPPQAVQTEANNQAAVITVPPVIPSSSAGTPSI
jgi:CRISPR/Cas system CSM-associated protein Csm2 small subunit